ncbi:MAG: alpha/beta hydrolase [Caldilineaceae bacterium]|nr:alpha/beta hydrolase [Caldilineaceae bacterium]HRJ43524.1 alpha/beta hydrolase [Caldilineaceae bacterium]
MKNRFVFPSALYTDREGVSLASLEQLPYRLLHEGCHLHYWISGPALAPLVVCIHSEGSDHRSFDAQVQRLSRSYRVLTMDLRGHGLSKSVQLFSLEQAVDDIHAILSQEGFTNGILIGASVGGLIAQHFAQRFPDFVLGLALLSCRPLNGQLSPTSHFLGKLGRRLLRMMPYWFILARMPAQFSLRPEVQEYTAEAMQECGKEHFLAAWQANFPESEIGSAPQFSQPLLVALGAYDRSQWLAQSTAQWTAANPAIRIVSVPGAGHSLLQDNPSFTCQILVDFCSLCLRERRHTPAAHGQEVH